MSLSCERNYCSSGCNLNNKVTPGAVVTLITGLETVLLSEIWDRVGEEEIVCAASWSPSSRDGKWREVVSLC